MSNLRDQLLFINSLPKDTAAEKAWYFYQSGIAAGMWQAEQKETT